MTSSFFRFFANEEGIVDVDDDDDTDGTGDADDADRTGGEVKDCDVADDDDEDVDGFFGVEGRG